jgi:predicted GIY-YIG superfamily endonuclease
MTSVYLIKAGQTNNYKIGISDNPQSRLSNIQTSHYEKLSIVKSVEYSTRFIALSVEEFLHKKYKKFNTVGEWFVFDSGQIKEIQKYLEFGVTEVIFLKARIKELEQQLRDEKAKNALVNIKSPITDKNSVEKKPKTQKKQKTRKDISKTILEGIDADGKVIAKAKLIDINNRAECNMYREVVRELQQDDILEYRNGYGYFLKGIK